MIQLTDEEIKRVMETMSSQGIMLNPEDYLEEGKAVAKAQLKKVVEWGDEPCYIHLVKDGAVDTTEGIKRRECPKCWQALLEEVKE